MHELHAQWMYELYDQWVLELYAQWACLSRAPGKRQEDCPHVVCRLEGRERATHRLGNTFAKQANKQDLFWRSRWCLRKRRWARLIEEHLWSTVPNVGQWSFECQDLDCRHLLLTLKMWPGSSRSYLQSLQNAQEWYVHYLNGVHHVLELNARYCQSHMLTFVRAICSLFFQSYMLSFPSSYMFFYTKNFFFFFAKMFKSCPEFGRLFAKYAKNCNGKWQNFVLTFAQIWKTNVLHR